MAEDGEAIMKWKDIYEHLKSNGFDVYSLAQRKGICKSPYLVLRNNGSNKDGSTTTTAYEILVYVPVNQYSFMEDYIEEVQDCMQKLFPAVQVEDGQNVSLHYLDDDVQAYMCSLPYVAPHIKTNINGGNTIWAKQQ